jgi:hypothetical protein
MLTVSTFDESVAIDTNGIEKTTVTPANDHDRRDRGEVLSDSPGAS